jgi:hypothetical protein
VDNVTTLFALADKCARAAEGRAWHSAPQAGVTQTDGSGAVAQDGVKKKKRNKGRDRENQRVAASVVSVAAGGQGKRNKRSRPQEGSSNTCPVHPNSRHSAADCRDIIKLAKHVSKRRERSPRDDSPPRRWLHEEGVDDKAAAMGGQDLTYQSPEKNLRDVFTEETDSGNDDDRRKKLYVMYGGSWELVSRRSVKTLRREVLSVVPGIPKAAPHQRWRGTTISFRALDCPDNMAGAGVLPLITAPIVANMQLHHVLIDGGAGLNVISHAMFRQLQIPGSRLGASHPFSGVGPQPVYPLESITLPVTFGTEENFRTENVQFDVAEVNLPFNAIIGRPALYRFMVVAHYEYFVLKMPSPAGVLTVRGDRTATLAAVEKLHTLAAETARPNGGGRSSSAPGAKAPKVLPTKADGGHSKVTAKTIQVDADPSRTTRIAGDLGEK